MEEDRDERTKVRRRMRGIAMLFIIVSVIGLIGVAILWASAPERLSSDLIFGRIIALTGLLFGGIATWNGSRIASLMIIAILCTTPVIAMLGQFELSLFDWIRSVVFLALAAVMSVSAFKYWRLMHQGDTGETGKSLLRWGGKAVAGAVVLVVGFGTLIISFGTPSVVLRGSEIAAEDLKWMMEQGFLLEGEQPLFAYYDGVFAIEEGGSLLTDQYAGGWWLENGELHSSWIKLGQICRFEEKHPGDALQNAIYSIHDPGNQTWIELWLSVENGMHKRFLSRMKVINKRKMRPEIQQLCDEDRPIDWVEIAAMNGISQDIVDESAVSELQRAWLVENEFLLDNETIKQFYSHGTFAIDEGGVLLTDRYIGGWYKDVDEVQAWWFELGEICSFDVSDPGSEGSNALFKLTGPDEAWGELSLPNQNGEGQALIDRVRAINAVAQSTESRSACEAGGVPDESPT